MTTNGESKNELAPDSAAAATPEVECKLERMQKPYSHPDLHSAQPSAHSPTTDTPWSDRRNSITEMWKEHKPSFKKHDSLTAKDIKSIHEPEHAHNASKAVEGERRRSIGDNLFHHERRKSISDSGPLVVEQNPATGHYLAHKNPHWPEEDSWKRANVRSGSGDDSEYY